MKTSKIFLVAAMGNVLEFYDFTLFAFFVPLLAKIYFPTNDPQTSKLLALSVFSVSFLTRPIGGLFFGHIGDEYGRKIALVGSILLMAVPTGIIGILPSYELIGISAPIILVFCRLLQGLCTGGEYNGAAIFILEHSGVAKKGFASGLMVGTCFAGSLFAQWASVILSQSWIPQWGWRLGFIFGAIFGVIGFYVRSKVSESPEFQSISPKTKMKKAPVIEIFTNNLRGLFLSIGVAFLSGILGWTMIAYFGIALRKNPFLDAFHASLIHTITLFIAMIMFPLFGHICDRTNNRDFIMSIGAILLIIFSFPIYYCVQFGTFFIALLGGILISVFCGAFSGAQHVVYAKLFPAAQRYTGSALGLGFATVLAGATPTINEVLISATGSSFSPAIFLSIGSVISLFSLQKAKGLDFSESGLYLKQLQINESL